MSFKGFPWELLEKYPEIIDLDRPGFYGIKCYDAFIEKIFLNKLPRKKLGDDFLVLVGPEVTKEWLEQNIREVDLFSTKRSYLLLQADQMNKSAKDFLLEQEWDWDGRFFIAVFSSEGRLFDQFEKKEKGTFIKVESPRFWENSKLFQFLSDETRVRVSYVVQNYLLEAIPNNPGELINALKTIAIHFSKTADASVDEIKTLIRPSKIDQFELAGQWGEKRFESFFQFFIDVELDFETLRSFFSFMQGHLFKMADPSYIDKKGRPSKYDKKIQVHAQAFSKQELRDAMLFFGKLEILAKRKSPELQNSIRKELISLYL